MLKKIINIIEINGGKILRFPKNKNEDIDIYIASNNFEKIKFILENKFGLVCIKNEKSTFSYIKFLDNGEIFLVDFHFHFHYIFYYFQDIYFKKEFEKKYLKNVEDRNIKKIFNFIRYLFLLRNGKKYFNFLNNHFNLINDINKNLTGEIFKKRLEKKDLKSFLDRKILILFKYLKIKYFLTYYFGRIKEIFGNLFYGKIIVLDGPDGSGKTTLLEKLNKFVYSKYLYCGKRMYFFEEKYKNTNIFFQKIYFITFLLEDFFRILKIFYWRNRGYIVFCDRYPKYATYLEGSLLGKLLYYCYYIFFPNPDKYIFIKVDKKNILLRKKEEYDEKNIDKNYKFFTGKKGINIVENNGKIEDTLNNILKIIFN